MSKVIGLIVNPVAGMGGSVGLKGTDGRMYERALALGADPVTPQRTQQLLAHISRQDEIGWLVAPGRMGGDYVADASISFTVVGEIGKTTSAEDTRRVAQEMVDRGADLLVFVGGDGTARDICDAVGTGVPVVGVPAGVKVFSAAFALSARAAADMVDAFVCGVEVTEEEVLDIDEEAFRDDRLASKLYGYLRVPEVRTFLQPGKAASNVGKSATETKQAIAEQIVEEMDPGTLYLLGPGTTAKAITDRLGLPKTLLGVDAVLAGKLVGEDVNEKGILDLLERCRQRKIVVTPIGGNGFIFGRGSKQFTPDVIRQVGRENIIVVGTPDKVSGLDCLRVDTGDLALDEALSGYLEVTIGYRDAMVMEVRCR
ncbi:MAG: ATP-NAD kinase family protein [Anaerolineae bacterium]|nr:ATP-NAD kinase family protein [Anaerolineae bacterium]